VHESFAPHNEDNTPQTGNTLEEILCGFPYESLRLGRTGAEHVVATIGFEGTPAHTGSAFKESVGLGPICQVKIDV
jgi:hypothetical protein